MSSSDNLHLYNSFFFVLYGVQIIENEKNKKPFIFFSMTESLNLVILICHCEQEVVVIVVATKNILKENSFYLLKLIFLFLFPIFIFPSFSILSPFFFLLLSLSLFTDFSNFLLHTRGTKAN